MSNKNEVSSANLRGVRWRMNLPEEVCETILSIAIAEEREPGAVAARWLKSYWKEKYSSKKEI